MDVTARLPWCIGIRLCHNHRTRIQQMALPQYVLQRTTCSTTCNFIWHIIFAHVSILIAVNHNFFDTSFCLSMFVSCRLNNTFYWNCFTVRFPHYVQYILKWIILTICILSLWVSWIPCMVVGEKKSLFEYLVHWIHNDLPYWDFTQHGLYS